VFVDAPGVTAMKGGINPFLRSEAAEVISQSDVIVAVLGIDEREIEPIKEVLQLCKSSGKPCFVVIHKTDLPLAHRPQILRDLATHHGLKTIQGSSLNADSAKDLASQILEQVSGLLPLSEKPLYDKDLYTLSSVRDLSAEIIREKCFLELHQEVPFGLAVRLKTFDEDNGAVVRINAEIMVSKESHKPMVIGRGGAMIKQIGTEARKEIEKLIDRRVFLELNVNAKQDWFKNPLMLRDLGYVIHPN
jgi:GTPase